MHSNIFSLSHPTPVDFYTSNWQKNHKSLSYVIYRLIVAFVFLAFMVGWFITDFINETGIIIDFIYLTNVSFLLSTVTMCLSAYLATLHYKSELTVVNCMTGVHKLFWIISTISTTAAVTVSLNYWILVHNPEQDEINFNNIMTHVMNAVILLIDLLVTTHPGKFKFCIFPTSFGAIYLLFTWIYAAVGGRNK